MEQLKNINRTYTDARLETACELAISRGIKTPRYHHLKAIQTANQDITYQEQLKSETLSDNSSMGYLRGSDYYQREVIPMLNDETRRKLRLLNVGEFIEELEIQQQDPQTLALPFDDRFQLLTDSIYQWKYNEMYR